VSYIAAFAEGQGRLSIQSLQSLKPSSSAASLLLKDRPFDALNLDDRAETAQAKDDVL